MGHIDMLIWVDKEIRGGMNDTIHDFLAFLAEYTPNETATLSVVQKIGACETSSRAKGGKM